MRIVILSFVGIKLRPRIYSGRYALRDSELKRNLGVEYCGVKALSRRLELANNSLHCYIVGISRFSTFLIDVLNFLLGVAV